MKDLTFKELIEINGGSDPDGCAGCSAGKILRGWISDFLNIMGRQGHVGMPGQN